MTPARNSHPPFSQTEDTDEEAAERRLPIVLYCSPKICPDKTHYDPEEAAERRFADEKIGL